MGRGVFRRRPIFKTSYISTFHFYSVLNLSPTQFFYCNCNSSIYSTEKPTFTTSLRTTASLPIAFMSSSTTARVFSPACPIPHVFNVEEYIARLYDRLDPQSPRYEMVEQHVNLKALIKLYETGERKDNSTRIYLVNGKVVPRLERKKIPGSWCLMDVCFSSISRSPEHFMLTESEL